MIKLKNKGNDKCGNLILNIIVQCDMLIRAVHSEAISDGCMLWSV